MTTGHYSTVDLDNEAQPYEGRILDQPVIERKISDPVFRTIEPRRFRFSLRNDDGALTAAYLADLRGQPCEAERYDQATETVYGRVAGVVTRAALMTGKLLIEGEDIRQAVLEQEIPRGIVTTATWPKALDVGKVIQVVLGNVPKVRARYVREDTSTNQYDFLLGHGALGLFTDGLGNKVYRSPERTELTAYPVQASEYTLSTSLYPGYTVLRFPVAQWDWTNARDTIWANVAGLQPERNFARAIRTILSNSTWGLGQPVNAVSFDLAEAQLAAIGGLFCDGVIDDTTQAYSILRQLCMVRGMLLGLNDAGEWTLRVDIPSTTVSLVVRDGPDEGTRNLIDCGPRSQVDSKDAVRDVILKYRRDLLNDTLLHEQSRQVSNPLDMPRLGKDLPIDCGFIRDHGTADRVADYLGHRIGESEETVDVTMTQDARALVEGDLVSLTYAPLAYAGATLRVRELIDKLTTIDAVLEGYGAYTYAAGTLPTDAEGASLVELTRTAPNPATGLSVVASGTEQATDGTWSAFLTLQFTTPTLNYQHALVQYRKNGTTVWSPGMPVPSSGVNVQAKIPGLVSGQSYDFTVMIVSPFGKQSVGNPLLLNQPAPFDTVAPNTPTGLVATAGVGSVVSLRWDASTAADFAEFHVHRNTADSFPVDANGKLTAATKIAEVAVNQFSDNEVPQGTQQFYKVVASDRSENRSVGSATVNATPTGGAQGTTPGTPIAPTLNTSGPYQSSDGTTLAFVVVNLPALPSNAAMLDVLIRANGQTPWQKVDQNPTGGGTSRIDDLTPGFAYQIALRAWNNSGKASAVSGVLLHVGAGDTTAPAAPTSLTVRQGGGKVVEILVNGTPPVDWGTTELYRNTTNNSATATKIASAKGLDFHDQNVSYAAAGVPTYYYWAKFGDNTYVATGAAANLSAFSPSTAHSVTVVQIGGGDITPLGVGTGNLAPGAVTPAKTTAPASLSIAWALAGGARTTITFFPGTSFVSRQFVASGNVDVAATIVGVGAETTTVLLHNLRGGSEADARSGTAVLYFW